MVEYSKTFPCGRCASLESELAQSESNLKTVRDHHSHLLGRCNELLEELAQARKDYNFLNDAYRHLQTERNELKAVHERTEISLERFMLENGQLEAANSALREALKKYGQHLPPCHE